MKMHCLDISFPLNIFRLFDLTADKQPFAHKKHRHQPKASALSCRVPKVFLFRVADIDKTVHRADMHGLWLSVPAVPPLVLICREGPVRKQDHHGRAVAGQHGDDARRVLGRLVRYKRLRPNEVSGGVANGDETITMGKLQSAEHLLGVALLDRLTCKQWTFWCVQRHWLVVGIYQ